MTEKRFVSFALFAAMLVFFFALLHGPSGDTPAQAAAVNVLDGPTTARGTITITSGKLVIGATGTGISRSVRASSAIDIASVSAVTCLDTSVTVTGAAVGDECIVGLPAAPQANLGFTCFVSAANTAKLRACNPTAGALDPASATYSIRTFAP